EPRELLADRRTRAAQCAAGFGEQSEVACVARGMGERGTPALVREDGHGDLPAFADLADQVHARHARILEENLAELALTGDLSERPDRHAGRVELHEKERDAAVTILRVGAGEHEDPVGPRPERRPNL